jgi:hypothetical protein
MRRISVSTAYIVVTLLGAALAAFAAGSSPTAVTERSERPFKVLKDRLAPLRPRLVNDG